VDERAEVPAVAGGTVGDARAALGAAGFALLVADGTGDDWVVLTQSIGAGTKADPGTEITLTAEAPKFNSKSRVQKGYDPHDMVQRAKTLCSQMKEAFPQDVGDFGCPANPNDITTELQAQNTINLVCDTIRYSVPSITPEQFNCPPPLRSGFA
jgi:hypothetical protein